MFGGRELKVFCRNDLAEILPDEVKRLPDIFRLILKTKDE
jgi:hypothetical protein